MASSQEVDAGLIHTLIEKLEDTALGLEKANLTEYVEMYHRPGRYMFISFAAGVSKGFCIAIGYAVVAAIFVSFVFYLARLNLPVVGNYVADIAQIVRHKLY